MTDEQTRPRPRGARVLGWVALFLLPVLAFAWVAVPVFKIQPFAPQTPEDLSLSYTLRNWSTAAAVAATAAALALAFWLWRGAGRWWRRGLLVLPCVPLLFLVWFTRQNHFEWMFSPLARGEYAEASGADFVAPGEMVLAVKVGDDAVAFPVRQAAYHHVIEATVGGRPVVATY
jgi:hypothetical protein